MLKGESMNQADLDRAERLSTQHQEYEAIAYRNVCAICGSALMVPWNAQKDDYELVCSQDRNHKGYERLHSLYQKWRNREALPIEVAQAMEHKYGKRKEESK